MKMSRKPIWGVAAEPALYTQLCFQPKRGCVLQPRVASCELPWVFVFPLPNPKAGCACLSRPRQSRKPTQPRWGSFPFNVVTQGRHPGCQPWAGGHNPFGVEDTNTALIKQNNASLRADPERPEGRTTNSLLQTWR